MRPDSPRRSNKPDAEWINNEKRRCHDRGMRLEVRRNEMQILKDDHLVTVFTTLRDRLNILFRARREYLEV